VPDPPLRSVQFRVSVGRLPVTEATAASWQDRAIKAQDGDGLKTVLGKGRGTIPPRIARDAASAFPSGRAVRPAFTSSGVQVGAAIGTA